MESAARDYGVNWLLWGLVLCDGMHLSISEVRGMSVPVLVQALAVRDVWIEMQPRE